MERLIDKIRKKYPIPIQGHKARTINCSEQYCVGGAYIRWKTKNDGRYGFPGATELYDFGIPFNIAYSIIEKNDSGSFEEAWQLLAEAIEKKRPLMSFVSLQEL